MKRRIRVPLEQAIQGDKRLRELIEIDQTEIALLTTIVAEKARRHAINADAIAEAQNRGCGTVLWI
jgi:hypothetical protein